MKSYEEGKRVYWAIRTNKRRQFASPVPRETIEIFQKGFEAGFSRGFEAGLKQREK